MNRNLEVVLSPAVLPFYEIKGKTVVVIDILRATSSMCVAFQSGVDKILPVSTPEECLLFRDFDFLCAAERNAVKLEGFDMGNSPFEFQNPLLKDKKIAFTTTNGTKAIKLSRQWGASQVAIGSFLNIDVLCSWLLQQTNDVVLLCSGWKDLPNLEDTLFAGAVAEKLENEFSSACDSTLMALSLYASMKNDLEQHVRKSSHAQRFKLLHTGQDDVSFCLQFNTAPALPLMQGEYMVNAQATLQQ